MLLAVLSVPCSDQVTKKTFKDRETPSDVNRIGSYTTTHAHTLMSHTIIESCPGNP